MSSTDIAASWQITNHTDPTILRHIRAFRALVIASVQLHERENAQSRLEPPPDQSELLKSIQETYNDVYFARRSALRDDLFLAGIGCEYTDDQDVTHYWERVDGDIGSHFEAHGITKGNRLSTLLHILEHGIDPSKPFHTAPFEVADELKAALGAALGTASGTAYKDGLAVLVSGYNASLQRDGIQHVFINDVFGALKPLLQQAFHKYRFHLLSEQKAILEAEAHSSQ